MQQAHRRYSREIYGKFRKAMPDGRRRHVHRVPAELKDVEMALQQIQEAWYGTVGRTSGRDGGEESEGSEGIGKPDRITR